MRKDLENRHSGSGHKLLIHMVEERSYLLEDCTACQRLVLVPESKLELFHQSAEENCPFCPHPFIFEHEYNSSWKSWIATWKWGHMQQKYHLFSRSWREKELTSPEPVFPDLRCDKLERGEECECDCDKNRHSSRRGAVPPAVLWRKVNFAC